MIKSYLLLAAMSLAAVGASAQSARNVSQGCSATASSPDAPEVAKLGCDGDVNSRWESAGGIDDVTWTVDLGKVFTNISEVQILWEGAYAKSFDIEVSDDGETFTSVANVTDQSLSEFPYLQSVPISNASGRYVRFAGKERGTAYGYSFWEFRVMSSMFDPDSNIALGKTATAGLNSAEAGSSNDGNLNTRWGSAGDGKDDYANQWWMVDLGAAYNLRNIQIFWEGAYAEVYVIEGRTSETGEWKTLASVDGAEKTTVGNSEESGNTISLVGKTARYLRIRSTQNSLGNAYGMSIWEVRVYANSVATSIRKVMESLPVKVAGCTVTVTPSANSGVDVFTLNGVRVFTSAPSSESVSVTLPAGSYVVKSGAASSLVSLH